MKKLLIVVLLMIAVGAAVVGYGLNNAGAIIKQQVERQGSRFFDTQVSLANADLAVSEGRLTLTGLTVANPPGFSANTALAIDAITIDLQGSASEPYVLQAFSVIAPTVLYESNATGGSNLLALKQAISKHLPRGQTSPSSETGPAPTVIVDNITIVDTALTLDLSALATEQFGVTNANYAMTLPTISVAGIGQPNGIPANQVGAAIADAMLNEIIQVAKREAKETLKDKAKEKYNEKINKQKDKLKEKAKQKIKGLFG